MKIFPFPSMLVGMTRFELATSGPPDRCATGLRHIPLVEMARRINDAYQRHWAIYHCGDKGTAFF